MADEKQVVSTVEAVSEQNEIRMGKLQELINAGKIIRPAYKSVQEDRLYVPLSER